MGDRESNQKQAVTIKISKDKIKKASRVANKIAKKASDGGKGKANVLMEEEDEEVLEDCVILKHRVDNEEEVEVLVKWLDDKKKEWMKLYDMWADYRIRVCEYRRDKQLKGKEWHNPTLEKMEYFVRVLSHEQPKKGKKLEDIRFCVLANNGFVVEDMSYKELLEDAQELLDEYVKENGL